MDPIDLMRFLQPDEKVEGRCHPRLQRRGEPAQGHPGKLEELVLPDTGALILPTLWAVEVKTFWKNSLRAITINKKVAQLIGD